MEFVIAFFSTVFGGLILASIFFILSDIIFAVPDFNGAWTLKTITNKSSYNPYNGMELTFLVLLWSEGAKIHGTGEKILEIANGQQREYVGINRSHISIEGYIEKRYLHRDKITLHIHEQSQSRHSSTLHFLNISGKKKLKGNFISTIANSYGSVISKAS